jgi:two-component system response regulator YesN
MYKILIVDDESLERKALHTIIGDNIPLISRFEEASDGQWAIDKVKETQPHIVLMDIQMPRVNGVDAAREIKKILPSCRIILMSGYTYFSYAREAVSIGLQDFLVKPIDDDELISSIQALVDGLENERRETGSEENINEIYGYYEREFLDSQISGKTEQVKLSRYLDVLEIQEEFFLGMILTRETKGTILRDKDLRSIREIASLCFVRDRVIISENDDKVYILLMLTEFRANLVLQEQLNAFLSYLDESLKIPIRISSGAIKSNSQQIFESFNEAFRAIGTENRISFYQHPQSPDVAFFPINDEEKLCELLLKADRPNAIVYMDSIYFWIDKNTKDLFQFKLRIYDLMVILNRRVRRALDPGDCIVYYRQINSLEARGEIKTYIISELHHLLDKLEIHLSASSKIWKKKIQDHIEQNFKQSISLEDLAGIAGFSAPYLSRIFKSEFGMNFSSYVHSLRIREAKNLLRQSDLSIKEISYELGFSDSNYFARVFKKMTGINASQFQNDSELLN